MSYKAAVEQSATTENQTDVLEDAKNLSNVHSVHVEPAITDHDELNNSVSIPIAPTTPQESTDSFLINSNQVVQDRTVSYPKVSDEENVHELSPPISYSKPFQESIDVPISIPQHSASIGQDNKQDAEKQYPILPNTSSIGDNAETKSDAATINNTINAKPNPIQFTSESKKFERQFSVKQFSPATQDNAMTASPTVSEYSTHQQAPYQQQVPPLLQYAQSQGILPHQGIWQSPAAQLQTQLQWQNIAMHQQSTFQQMSVPMMMPYYSHQMPFTPYLQIPINEGQYFPTYATNGQQWYYHDTYGATNVSQSPNVGEGDIDTMYFDENQLLQITDPVVDTTDESSYWCEICHCRIQNNDHYDLQEHNFNSKYQNILSTFEPIIQNEAKQIVNLSSKHHHVQNSKINECIKSFYLVKSNIESEETVYWDSLQLLENTGNEIVALIKELREQKEALEKHWKN